MAKTAGGDQNEPVLEGLKKVYVELAQLNLAPDAGQHAPFLQALQQGITKYIQEQHQLKAQQAAQMSQQVAGMAARGGPQGQPGMGGGGMGGPPGMGGPGGGGPGPMGGPPSSMAGTPGAPPPGGGPPGMNLPNPDELRRILQTQGSGA